MANSTIYDFLERVRKRPNLYLRSKNLKEIEDYVLGYYAALSNHHIIEPCPQLTQSHFLSWLRISKRSLSTGWALSLEHHCPDDKDILEYFFEAIDEYQQLNFVQHMEIQLAAKHNPTRARCKIGIDKKLEKPLHVTVCSYQPVEMYFLLLKYSQHTTVGHIFFDNGKIQTSLEYATQWCLDELQIEAIEWKKVQ